MDRAEVFAMLVSAAPGAYNIAKEKGWWDDKETNPCKSAENTMLIVSELGEALDAHRKERRPKGPDAWEEILNSEDSHWKDRYDTYVKGTMEEEMADVVIRILSLAKAYGVKFHADTTFKKESTKNFGADLLRINQGVLEAYHGMAEDKSYMYKDWSYVLKSIIALCDWWKIDIIPHVKWKLKYTKLKTSTDGKKY
jgi:NTP pyrophosphatase (non-canonical NTP hydrolase)